MKKFLALASAATIASLFSMSPANAQIALPDGSYNISGYLDLYQTIPGVGCDVSGDLIIAGGVSVIDNVTFSGAWPCGTPVYPLTTSWSVQSLSSGKVGINVDVNAATGRCVGLLQEGTLNATHTEIDFGASIATGATVDGWLYPWKGAYVPCKVAGILYIS